MTKNNLEIKKSHVIFALILVSVLAFREWFIEVVLDDVTSLLNATPKETWFILGIAALAGAFILGMNKK